MKTDVLVRFAGDSTYYHRITIDPKKIEEPMVFPNEVDEIYIPKIQVDYKSNYKILDVI